MNDELLSLNNLSARSQLKNDHRQRPIWVSPNNRIILEAFSPAASQAKDFLLAIAEPLTRPKHIHEYVVTENSLFAGVSVGLSADDIINAMEKLCKTAVPIKMIEFIKSATKKYGRVKLVLKENRYWIEVEENEVLKKLLCDKTINESQVDSSAPLQVLMSKPVENVKYVVPKATYSDALLDIDDEFKDVDPDMFADEENGLDIFAEFADANPDQLKIMNDTAQRISDLRELNANLDIQESSESLLDIEEPPSLISSFEIQKAKVEAVKKRCAEISLPVLEEYDFRADKTNPTLDIDLKPNTSLRPYQEKSLGKLFSNGRARSGIIVLPCGAGKSLVGVTAACTIKKSVIVLCNSTLSVEQWTREFKFWSTINPSRVARFSSEMKEFFEGNAGILITTYSMVTFSGKRSVEAEKMIEIIKSREWGFLILDEVHIVPADMFKKTLTIVSAHSKLGLTATLVREDEKIESLNWLIGPKLFEANWQELANDGFIANVSCSEVWCTMTYPFFREYLRESGRRRQLLYVMNPRKIQSCQYLINLHESMGDKIIVFSDNIFALKHYAGKLNKPFIYGGTSQSERMRVLQQFRYNPALNTVFLSKVGDTSIDLPEATCLIQISSHYGSRRQEAQRLGRILRPKKGRTSNFSAYFYSLVSTDTQEMFFSSRRQQFLINQGYEFKIITNIESMVNEDSLYTNKSDELALLNTVLLCSEKEMEDEETPADHLEVDLESSSDDDISFTRKTSTSLKTVSGGEAMAYLEFTRGSTSGLDRSRIRFRKK